LENAASGGRRNGLYEAVVRHGDSVLEGLEKLNAGKPVLVAARKLSILLSRLEAESTVRPVRKNGRIWFIVERRVAPVPLCEETL